MQNAPNLFLIAAFGGEAFAALYDLRWMLVCALILVIADFWFGISDSLSRHAEFRFSRAGRRTCNKIVDYLAYLLVGCTVGLAIFEPLGITTHTVTAAIGLGFGCLWEVDSIVGHICAVKGVENRFSVKRFLIAILRRRLGPIGEAVEEGLKDEGKETNH